MKFIGNIIWLLFGGIIAAILWAIAGLLLCVTIIGIPFTIIGIPFGLQHFKLAMLGLIPFGARIHYD